MVYSPIRIKRETVRVENSNIHWLEKVEHHVLLACDVGKLNELEGVAGTLGETIKRYEKMTYRLRNKAFEKQIKGKLHLSVDLYSWSLLRSWCMHFGLIK